MNCLNKSTSGLPFLKFDFCHALNFSVSGTHNREQSKLHQEWHIAVKEGISSINNRSSLNSRGQKILLKKINVQEPEENWSKTRSQQAHEAFMGNLKSTIPKDK